MKKTTLTLLILFKILNVSADEGNFEWIASEIPETGELEFVCWNTEENEPAFEDNDCGELTIDLKNSLNNSRKTSKRNSGCSPLDANEIEASILEGFGQLSSSAEFGFRTPNKSPNLDIFSPLSLNSTTSSRASSISVGMDGDLIDRDQTNIEFEMCDEVDFDDEKFNHLNQKIKNKLEDEDEKVCAVRVDGETYVTTSKNLGGGANKQDGLIIFKSVENASKNIAFFMGSKLKKGALSASQNNDYYNSRKEAVILKMIGRDQRGLIAPAFAVEKDNRIVYASVMANSGEISDYIQNNSLDDSEVKDLAVDIIEGLSTLHTKKVFHNDIRPPNIVVNKDSSEKTSAKLIDFGAAVILESEYNPNSNPLWGLEQTGTIGYTSPEAIKRVLDGEILPLDEQKTDQEINQKIERLVNNDLWSLGLTFYELATGKNPTQWLTSNKNEFQKFMAEKLTQEMLDEGIEKIDNNHPLKEATKCLLTLDPKMRCSLEQAKGLIYNTSRPSSSFEASFDSNTNSSVAVSFSNIEIEVTAPEFNDESAPQGSKFARKFEGLKATSKSKKVNGLRELSQNAAKYQVEDDSEELEESEELEDSEETRDKMALHLENGLM